MIFLGVGAGGEKANEANEGCCWLRFGQMGQIRTWNDSGGIGRWLLIPKKKSLKALLYRLFFLSFFSAYFLPSPVENEKRLRNPDEETMFPPAHHAHMAAETLSLFIPLHAQPSPSFSLKAVTLLALKLRKKTLPVQSILGVVGLLIIPTEEAT